MSADGIALPGPHRKLRARRRILAAGVLAVGVVGFSTAVAVRPLRSSRSETRQVVSDNATQRIVEDLRVVIQQWQLFVEVHAAQITTARPVIDPAELSRGAGLATDVQTESKSLAASLRALGLTRASADVSRANDALAKSISGLSPLLSGAAPDVVATSTARERAAYNALVGITDSVAQQLRAREATDINQAGDHLAGGQIAIEIGGVVFALVALVGAIVFGQRARTRERQRKQESERQTFEAMLGQGLEMAKGETEVYGVLAEALTSGTPRLQTELLVADSSRAHFRRVLTAGEDGENRREGCGVVSPKDCAATIRGHSLEFPSSRAINACPYLKRRATGACSAACVPVNIGGKSVAVVHATAPEARPPSLEAVEYLEIASRQAAERLAMLRAFERSEAQARSDPLTGLLNRRSLENRVHDIRTEGMSYVLAFGDLDHFKVLNDTHGHEAGDQALRLFSRVMRDSVRPDDVVARYGGEEFVIILPDCGIAQAVAVLERIRERLALALTSGRVPSFTVSFGVTTSTPHDTFDEALGSADRALLRAKAAGRNRVVLSDEPLATPEPDGTDESLGTTRLLASPVDPADAA